MCTFWDPVGLSNELSCMAGSLSHHHNPHRILQPEVLKLSAPMLEPWVAGPVSLPSYSSWVIHMQMWDHPVHQPPLCLLHSASCHLASHPLHPSFPSLPLLPVWMNVSLTSWLSDFHTVRFSGSSGYSLVLNLLLSFFWLCEQAKFIYIFFHLGRKSTYVFLKDIGFSAV